MRFEHYLAWKARWPAAAAELELLTMPPAIERGDVKGPEGNVVALVRLEASRAGHVLFRNNNGAGKLENGSFVRWGLANDSERVNKVLKSADLIGGKRVVITSQMVGAVILQFFSRECKAPGWKWSGTDREQAQMNWANMIYSRGGDAAIVSGEGSM